MKILHLTYDLRDRLNREKTTAVGDLIEQSKKFADALTVDLLRVQSFNEEIVKLVSKDHLMLNSFGLPFGILLKQNLNRATKKIITADQEKIIQLKSANLIHAHKLTYEGYIGYHLSKKLNLQLITSIRQTDFQVLKYKPHMRTIYKNILKQCRIIFYLVPFMIDVLEQKLGKAFFESYVAPKLEFLPNIIRKQPVNHVNPDKKKYLLTVLRMTRESANRKNIKRLFQAISELDILPLKLKIIGDGDYFPVVKSWAKRYRVERRVEFVGAIKNDDIDRYFADASAFVLPSKSESFGMVYAEALFCGTPILYSKKTGFDGLFENVGVAVDPFSVISIKNGLNDIIENNEFYRHTIQQYISNGSFNIFSAESVRERYRNAISKLI